VFAIKSFDENNVKITVDTILAISESKNSAARLGGIPRKSVVNNENHPRIYRSFSIPVSIERGAGSEFSDVVGNAGAYSSGSTATS
jgi:hypothetical protein